MTQHHPHDVSVAFHEAGHAVAEYLFGGCIESMGFVPKTKRIKGFNKARTEGWCTSKSWWEKLGVSENTPMPRSIAHEEAILNWAGIVAEAIHDKEDRLDICDTDARSRWRNQDDFKKVRCCIELISGDKDNDRDFLNDAQSVERIKTPFTLTFQQITDETWKLLATPAHWRAVTALAEAVLEREQLSREEIGVILQPLIESPPANDTKSEDH